MNIRRVVTGHDQYGRATVLIDELCGNVISRRPNHQSCVVWSTGEFPADNSGNDGGGARKVASTDPGGTVFRLVEYQPGVAPRNHRTESVDYAVVVSGAITMDLDGTEVHLRQGDVLVQRGTRHNWINRGTEPCVIAFVLIAAKPVEREGKTLGVPQYAAMQWYELLAPGGTPAAVVLRLHAETVKALHSDEIKQKLAVDGAEPVGSSPAEFAQLIADELSKWTRVARAAGIQPQ